MNGTRLTCLYQDPQRVTKTGEAKTLLLCKFPSTHTIHASTPLTLSCHQRHPHKHPTHASTQPTTPMLARISPHFSNSKTSCVFQNTMLIPGQGWCLPNTYRNKAPNTLLKFVLMEKNPVRFNLPNNSFGKKIKNINSVDNQIL